MLHSLGVIRDAESWQDLPVYALGASSGGAFVLLLPFHIQLQVRVRAGGFCCRRHTDAS